MRLPIGLISLLLLHFSSFAQAQNPTSHIWLHITMPHLDVIYNRETMRLDLKSTLLCIDNKVHQCGSQQKLQEGQSSMAHINAQEVSVNSNMMPKHWCSEEENLSAAAVAEFGQQWQSAEACHSVMQLACLMVKLK